MKIGKRLFAVSVALCIFSAMTMVSNATNPDFTFKLQNTDTTYNVYTGASNMKLYSNDSATVKTTYNDAPGYGMTFCMKHYNGSGSGTYITDTVTNHWLSGCGTIHPVYLANHNVTERYYYVAARIDNDYYGNYGAQGVFNADYTTP